MSLCISRLLILNYDEASLFILIYYVSYIFYCFSSDITEEDLEEAGVLDPTHKRILLESLRQQQQQQK